MKGKASYTIIIISLLIQAFFYMFVITGDSGSTYDKYESGEYYLRARAYTTDFELTNDNALQYSELDMSDPMQKYSHPIPRVLTARSYTERTLSMTSL